MQQLGQPDTIILNMLAMQGLQLAHCGKTAASAGKLTLGAVLWGTGFVINIMSDVTLHNLQSRRSSLGKHTHTHAHKRKDEALAFNSEHYQHAAVDSSTDCKPSVTLHSGFSKGNALPCRVSGPSGRSV